MFGEQEINRGGKEREKETEEGRDWRVVREKGDRREDWMGRAGSPIYKGEPGDYDLPFVRSFQLFCPIKISIFSPIAATLAGSPFAVSLTSLPPPLPLPFHPGHPPYGNIDRAQPRDSSPSHPRPSCYTATAFSSSLFLSISLPPLLFLLLRSFISFNLSSLSLFSSLFFFLYVSTYAIPASIFNYWLRERSWTIRKKRETKSLTVSACTQTGTCFTALLRLPTLIKKREIETEREWERVSQVGG